MRSRASRILPATPYRLAITSGPPGGGAKPARSSRRMLIVPRRSAFQSLYTSRTSSIDDPVPSRKELRPPPDGPNRSSNVPSAPTSMARSSNALRLSGTSTGE